MHMITAINPWSEAMMVTAWCVSPDSGVIGVLRNRGDAAGGTDGFVLFARTNHGGASWCRPARLCCGRARPCSLLLAAVRSTSRGRSRPNVDVYCDDDNDDDDRPAMLAVGRLAINHSPWNGQCGYY